jgi:hypothetical protein
MVNHRDDGIVVHVSFLEALFLGWISGTILVVFGPLLQEIGHCSGTFFSIILLSFLAGCICMAIS